MPELRVVCNLTRRPCTPAGLLSALLFGRATPSGRAHAPQASEPSHWPPPTTVAPTCAANSAVCRSGCRSENATVSPTLPINSSISLCTSSAVPVRKFLNRDIKWPAGNWSAVDPSIAHCLIGLAWKLFWRPAFPGWYTLHRRHNYFQRRKRKKGKCFWVQEIVCALTSRR